MDLLCGPTASDPLGTESENSYRRHPCTRPPRLRMPSSAGYVARHKYPQRLDYVFYRPTVSSLVEHAESKVEPFEVVDQPFEYLSDHFGIRAFFRFRCSFAWARQQKTSEVSEPSWRRLFSHLNKHRIKSLCGLASFPVFWHFRHDFHRTSLLPLLRQPTFHWRDLFISGLALGTLGALGILWRRRVAEASQVLERTFSVTAELASSAFRKRLKAQSERPAKTVASSPYDSLLTQKVLEYIRMCRFKGHGRC